MLHNVPLSIDLLVARWFDKTSYRMVPEGQADSSETVMLPAIRQSSLPLADSPDVALAVAVAKFDGLCRSSATDISRSFFSASPGVVALKMVRKSLRWAEETMQEQEIHCPFAGVLSPNPSLSANVSWTSFTPSQSLQCFLGATDYLYCKGSMSMQATKGWHDDANGPSTWTCWQNLGVVHGRDLHLVVCISGCRIHIPGSLGKVVHFHAWLPHTTTLTQAAGSSSHTPTDEQEERLHHTAYVKMGTEFAAWVLMEYKRKKSALVVHET